MANQPGVTPRESPVKFITRPEGAQPFHAHFVCAQSLTKNLIHLTFSTKERRPVLPNAVADGMHRYMAGILNDLDSPALLINSVADHAHVLFNLSKNHALADVVMEVKRGSSKWLKTQSKQLADFHWQSGYGAFSIGQSGVTGTTHYIAEQQKHHARKSFQQELKTLLERYEIPYDEQYLWRE